MADTEIIPRPGQLRLASRRPELIREEHTPATAGLARSGTTTSNVTTATIDYFEEFLDIVIDDDVRTRYVDLASLSITLGISDEPSTMSCVVIPRGEFEIERGNDIQVWLGGFQTGVTLFAGTILQISHSVPRASSPLDYMVEATDYRWLLDRFARVSATYGAVGINTIARNIIDTFTDPNSGFQTGYIPSSMGDIASVSFDNIPVSQALSRLSGFVPGGGFWTITPAQGGQKHISIFDEPYDEGNALALVDSGDWRNLEIHTDVSQAKNRVIVLGGGSQSTSVSVANGSTIAVEETQWFDPAGGTVRAGRNDVTFTSTSVGSGPGTLQGCSGINEDVPQGAMIVTRSIANDTDAQTALAAVLGGSQSGIAVHEERDDSLRYDEADLRAASLLTELSQPNIEVSYQLAPYPLNFASTYPGSEGVLELRPGRVLSVGLTAPVVLNSTMRVRSVTLTPRSRRDNGELVWNRSVSASLVIQRSNEPLGILKRTLGGVK